MDRTQSLSALLPQAPNFELQVKSLIAASEADIARLGSQIRDLQCRRATEHGVLARLRAAIAPIRKIPTELLVEIFIHVQQSGSSEKHDHTYPYGRMDIDRRPVHALSLVCSHWRRVAHTTPRLWTEHMETNLKKTPTAKYIARMADWLERSAPLPVPVAIHCCGLRGETRGTKVGPLVAVFVTAAHRWSRAEFSIDSLSALSQIPVNSLQSLEKLRLTSEDVNNHAQVQAFLTAARLRDVTLFTGCTAQLLMPWSQLTTINVKDMSPWDCLDTLVQCTTVVTAEFETKTWAVPPDLSGRQITTLARLENLEISFRHSDTGFFSPFFARLALPGLKNLSLSLNPDIIWQSLDFTRFQLGSPNIERLTIYNSDLTAQDLITVLRHAPSLVGLDTMYCPVSLDDSLLTSLRYSKTDTVHLAPSLQSLSLTEAGRNFEDNVLDTMIQSRWWMDDQSLAFPPHRRFPAGRTYTLLAEKGKVKWIQNSRQNWKRIDCKGST